MLHCQLVEYPAITWYGLERKANIGEGKRDPTTPYPRTRNFHNWKKLFQLPIYKPAKVDGQVPVGFVEYSRPSGPMKERTSWVRLQERIPPRIKQRIDTSIGHSGSFMSLRLRRSNFSIGYLCLKLHLLALQCRGAVCLKPPPLEKMAAGCCRGVPLVTIAPDAAVNGFLGARHCCSTRRISELHAKHLASLTTSYTALVPSPTR